MKPATILLVEDEESSAFFFQHTMTELGITNWIRFGIWMLVGLVIYFLYGYKHSKLNNRPETPPETAAEN